MADEENQLEDYDDEDVKPSTPLNTSVFEYDSGYPRTPHFQMLKLLTHAWDFGRFDLITYILEWVSVLVYTVLVFFRTVLHREWPWGIISISLYVAFGLGLIRSLFW